MVNGHRFLCRATLLCGLALSSGAQAADTPADSSAWYLRPLSVVTGAVKVVGSAAGSVWTGVSTLIAGGDPFDYMPSQIGEDDRRLFAVLDAAGLQLGEIKVGGGALSHSSYRFVAAREPSDVDIRRAEAKLTEYQAVAGGLRNGARQRIARAVLDVAGDKTFVLTAVVIELWPWPSVQYEMNARNRPLESGERRIVDATQQ